MRKIMCVVMSCLFAINLFCMGASAIGENAAPVSREDSTAVIMRASGSFSMSVSAYGQTEADKTFPMEAGETVSISAVYTPDDASMDFGLIDPDGVFHYFNVRTGSIDKTIRIEESGNYRLAVRNNSENTVKVSGFVKY